MEQAAAAEQALAKSDAAATVLCAARTVLECIALPLAEHRAAAVAERDALAAEMETLRYQSLELSVVEERCDWEPTVAPKWDEDGNEREASDRVKDLVDALRASQAEVARLREALEIACEWWGGCEHHTDDCPGVADRCKAAKRVNELAAKGAGR